MIASYFKDIERIFNEYDYILETYIITKDAFSDEKGFVEGELFFIDESRMSFVEVLDFGKNEKIKYSYHYMNQNNELVFRYDNAKHYPALKNFPHHKHIKDDVIESKEPDIRFILKEIENIVIL